MYIEDEESKLQIEKKERNVPTKKLIQIFSKKAKDVEV